MLFIVNKNIPAEAVKRLYDYGDVILFSTKDITYSSVANHPDIFLCKADDKIIYAPNTPVEIIHQLSEKKIECIAGKAEVGNKYPATAYFNAVITDEFIIHNKKFTDEVILQNNSRKKFINVRQGYTRCNLLPLRDGSFISSDEGITKKLTAEGLNCLYVNPAGIELPGFTNGFFGGACGITENKVFFTGSLNFFDEDEKVREYIVKQDLEIIELYHGKLFDGGSIIIIGQ